MCRSELTVAAAPVSLYGEGDYALTVVQQVVASQSFLGMSEEIRNCQKTPSLGDCVTRDYLDRLQAKCSCLPHSLGGEGVKVCGPRDEDCVATVTVNTGHCLVPCSGLYADVSNQLATSWLISDKQSEFKFLEAEYAKYKYFNEPQIKRSCFKGRTSYSGFFHGITPTVCSHIIDRGFGSDSDIGCQRFIISLQVSSLNHS